MITSRSLLIAFFAFIVAASTSAQTDTPVVIPGVQIGPVTLSSSAASLASELGEASVVTRDVPIGEGEMLAATVLFPNSAKEMTIFWQNQTKLARPRSVKISRPDSIWIHPAGVRMGSTMEEVEQANGGVFLVYGLEWDYGGQIAGWQGGNLAGDKRYSTFTGAFHYANPDKAGETTISHVLGDLEFPSNHPEFRSIGMELGEMTFHFPSIMDSEALGPFHLGMKASDVDALMAIEGDVSEEIEEGATGLWVQDIYYHDLSLRLKLASENEGGLKFVEAISAGPKFPFRTTSGIGVGSTDAAVKLAYADVLSEYDNDSPDTIVAGSIYGGVIVSIVNEKVTEIFIGAASE